MVQKTNKFIVEMGKSKTPCFKKIFLHLSSVNIFDITTLIKTLEKLKFSSNFPTSHFGKMKIKQIQIYHQNHRQQPNKWKMPWKHWISNSGEKSHFHAEREGKLYCWRPPFLVKEWNRELSSSLTIPNKNIIKNLLKKGYFIKEASNCNCRESNRIPQGIF